MKEKIYKKVQFYGKLTTITNQEYWLLAPLPVPGDSWQLEHQQSWYVVPNDDCDWIKINPESNSIRQGYPEPRHIVCSFPTIDPYLRDGYVWTGEYYDEEAAVEVEEPSAEDLEWYHSQPVTVDDIIKEVAND